nr:MAG TPA: hypothetical protein [Caudoviricetes sp.]
MYLALMFFLQQKNTGLKNRSALRVKDHSSFGE